MAAYIAKLFKIKHTNLELKELAGGMDADGVCCL